jgi:hypothetical protein
MELICLRDPNHGSYAMSPGTPENTEKVTELIYKIVNKQLKEN